MSVMGISRELLPMTYLRKDQQEVLAKNQLVRKKGGPQD